MKKWFPHVLGILIVNLLIGCLAYCSFGLLFRGDIFLAAAPALLAFPGILLQPWFIIFFFLPYGPVIAWLPTTVVTLLIYVFLYRTGRIDRISASLTCADFRRIAFAIVAVAAIALTIGLSRYYDFPSLHRKIPDSLHREIGHINLEVVDPRYYCLGQFLDSEWLWKARISENDLKLLEARLGLHAIPPEKVDPAFWDMPPYWWRPSKSVPLRIMATDRFPVEGRGNDGWHALAAWNPQNRTIYVWIKDNF